jgi:hypothetical protein
MKASKIRIVVILLLIIFFGLLILFGSSNIYEGATTATKEAATQGNPTTTAPTGDAIPRTFVDVNNMGVSYSTKPFLKTKEKYGSLNKEVPIKPTNFINVYYYFPDKYKPGFGKADLPIVYLYHNFSPNDYTIYFSNSIPFGSPTSAHQNIYIESKGKTITQPTACWKEYAVTSTTDKKTGITTFAPWIERQNWSGDAVCVVFKEASYTEKVINSTNNINGNKDNKPYTKPTADLSKLIPLKNEYQLTKTNGKKTMFFDAAYGSITPQNIMVDKTTDTNVKVGVVCLATYYFTFP